MVALHVHTFCVLLCLHMMVTMLILMVNVLYRRNLDLRKNWRLMKVCGVWCVMCDVWCVVYGV